MSKRLRLGSSRGREGAFGPLAERPLAERLKLAKLQRPAFPRRFLRDAAAAGGIKGEADG